MLEPQRMAQLVPHRQSTEATRIEIARSAPLLNIQPHIATECRRAGVIGKTRHSRCGNRSVESNIAPDRNLHELHAKQPIQLGERVAGCIPFCSRRWLPAIREIGCPDILGRHSFIEAVCEAGFARVPAKT